MNNNTREKLGGKNLGGLTEIIGREQSQKSKRTKYQPNLYIRKKNINGKPYYYACFYDRQPDGTYQEKQVYLGDANYVITACLEKRGKLATQNQGGSCRG